MNKPFLDGVRVIALTWVWAGPWMGAVLADMGAEVIKIESNRRLDTSRVLPPFAGGKPGPNRSVANIVNRGVKSCSIDLGQPKGVALLKDLIKVSDVVIENFSPRVMANLGLDYSVLKTVKSDIIMVSLPGFGSTGPDKDYVAYAATVEAVAGLSASFGYPGGEPASAFSYPSDPIGSMYGVISVVGALYYRNRTGKGQHVDIAQTEAAMSHIPDIFMEYVMNGRVRPRMGNRDEIMAPHGCYPCKGEDKWVAIAVGTDEEWVALSGAMGNPEWAREERFSDQFRRWHNQDELNRLIGEWTRSFTPYEVMHKLQEVGVAAGPSLNIEELVNDSHVKERHTFIEQAHPESGKTLVIRSPWASAEPKTPAPLLGEHNDYVFRGLLGMSDEEMTQWVDQKIIY